MPTSYFDTLNSQIGNILAKLNSLTPLSFGLPGNGTVLSGLAGALILAALMWLAYRLSHPAATYQPKFAVTLISLSLLATILMTLIQTNLALSLGMLGSLSIIRFRTNIRDPRDIGFIVWSITIGLSAATQNYLTGATVSLILGVFMILTRPRSQAPENMMLVVRGSQTDISVVSAIVEKLCQRSLVKAKNILADSFELVYEVQVDKTDGDQMIHALFGLGGIDSVNLLTSEQTI